MLRAVQPTWHQRHALGLPAPAAASYIVVLDPGIDPGKGADELAQSLGAPIHQVYCAALNGYATSLTAVQVAIVRADHGWPMSRPTG